MDTAAIHTRPPKALTTAAVTAVCLWLLPIAAFLALGKTLFALALVPIPLILLLCASPTACFYLFMLLVPIYYPYLAGSVAIWSFDLAMALLLFSLTVEFFLRGHSEIRPTGMDAAFLALIVATWLSAFWAVHPRESLVPSIRILVIYLAFRAIFTMNLRLGVRRIVLFYIYLVAVLALINLGLFVYYRGTERIFGPAWLAFENYSMTALPMALAFFIWARSRQERIRFGGIIILIAMAIVASGSRGTLLAVALGVPLLLFMAWRKTRRERAVTVKRSFNHFLVVATIVITVIALFASTLFTGFMVRMQEMLSSIGHPQGSIYLRIVLWTAALKAWLTSPLVGIGIGNFHFVDEIIPELKTIPVWYYIRGMTAHNVVLHYLAETGIFGVIALLTLTAAGLRAGLRVFRQRLSQADTQVSGAIMIAMAVFAMSIFFMRAWTWAQEGHVMAMLFGMTAAWRYEHRGLTPASKEN